MAYRTDTPHPAETNGERLSVLRRRKRWTQQRLAQESGYSLAAIRGFEQGRRSLDRGSVILALCRALDCHPTEITGQPYAPADGDRAGQEAAAAVAAVRRALLRHGRPARPSDAEAAAVTCRSCNGASPRPTRCASRLLWHAALRCCPSYFGTSRLPATCWPMTAGVRPTGC